MGNPQHLEWLLEGVDAWNARRERKTFRPDFKVIDIRASFYKAGLLLPNKRIPLRRFNLKGSNFNGAILWGADLKGADLGGAVFGGAVIKGADLKGADLRMIYLGDNKN